MSIVTGRSVLVAFVLPVLAALLLWVPAPPASAHEELVSSDPSESGVLEALPSAPSSPSPGRSPRSTR